MRDKLNHYYSSIILASASPARKEILLNEGLKVIVRPTDCDENLFELNNLNNQEKLITLAKRKLSLYEKKYKLKEVPVLCCDTLVFFNNNLVGKAKTEKQAISTLQSFSSNKQDIYTGFSLYLPNYGIFSGCDKASAFFNKLNINIIKEYIECKEWIGAAGSYRIQGKGSNLINHIEGDYNTIVGLPLFMISDLIKSTLT